MAMDDVALLSAMEMVARFQDRSLSPVEVTKAALERIDRHDGTFNAYCLVDAEGAIAAARNSEARWHKKGAPLGPVDGVPTSVKDLVLAKGWPTRRGSEDEHKRSCARRCAIGGAPQRIRRGSAWKDDHAGVRLEGRDRQPLTGVTRNP